MINYPPFSWTISRVTEHLVFDSIPVVRWPRIAPMALGERAGMEFQQQELPMPLTSKELIVLSKCLMAALKSEQFNEADKEVIRKMTIRIDRYAERQGAYWEK
jgi:hypothetical protein